MSKQTKQRRRISEQFARWQQKIAPAVVVNPAVRGDGVALRERYGWDRDWTECREVGIHQFPYRRENGEIAYGGLSTHGYTT